MAVVRNEFWHQNGDKKYWIVIKSSAKRVISVKINNQEISFWAVEKRFNTFAEMKEAIVQFVDLAIRAKGG
jgi:hypothetical protein